MEKKAQTLQPGPDITSKDGDPSTGSETSSNEEWRAEYLAAWKADLLDDLEEAPLELLRYIWLITMILGSDAEMFFSAVTAKGQFVWSAGSAPYDVSWERALQHAPELSEQKAD